MTRQHVFPDRLRRVLPRKIGVRLNAQAHRTTIDGKIRSNQKLRTSQGSTQTHRIRKVCLACNTGWMRVIEEEAFPVAEQLIRGDLASMSATQADQMMRLALNIAFVGEYLEADCVTTRQFEREHFKLTLTPPSKWFVFLGRDGTNLENPRFLSDGLALSEEVGVGAPKGFASFTMTMGRLLLHVLSMGEAFGVDPIRYGNACGMACLWPNATNIDVAGLPIFGEKEIATMRRFAGLSVRPFLA